MATTPENVGLGQAAYAGINDKLAAIIFLLANGMNAEAVAAGAAAYAGVPNKWTAIVYLLANGAAGGGGGLSYITTPGPPVGTPASLGLAYIIVDPNGVQYQWFNNQWN